MADPKQTLTHRDVLEADLADWRQVLGSRRLDALRRSLLDLQVLTGDEEASR